MSGKQVLGFALAAMFFVVLTLGASNVIAYERYNDGCQTCHGSFTGGKSTKGSVFPSGDKHQMHRSSSNMDTDCNLCHTSGDGRDPFIGSSDGTANNIGFGCVGCHGRVEDAGHDSVSAGLGAGLRQHHTNSGVNTCGVCHSDASPANYTPVGEDVMPAYYGTADTKVDDPCNPIEAAKTNENWTIGDFEGLDNDGDLAYDTADPDCVSTDPADFDADGDVDIDDVNALTAVGNLAVGVAVSPGNAKFDLNDDGVINGADLDQWLADAATINGLSSPYLRGDANLDGDVDVFALDGTGDAQILSSNLGMASGAVWGDGDFNGDGDVDVFALDGSGDAQSLSSNLGSHSL